MERPGQTIQSNRTGLEIGRHAAEAAAALFVNGFGVYLTIHAG